MNKKQSLILGALVFSLAIHSKTKAEPSLEPAPEKKTSVPSDFVNTNDNVPYDPQTAPSELSTVFEYNIDPKKMDDSDNSVDEDNFPAKAEVSVMNIDSKGTVTSTKTVSQTQSQTSDNGPSSSSFLDAWIEAGVPEKALHKALAEIQSKPTRLAVVPVSRGRPALAIRKVLTITNHRYLILNDFTRPSSQPRMFVMDFKTGALLKSLVAHGDGTGLLNAINFSLANKDRSHQTTPGFHVISETYSGKHGLTYALDGLEDRNSHARARLVVIHAAPRYATADFLRRKGYLGRSNGCPAVPPETMQKLLGAKGDGYAYDSETRMGTGHLTGALLYNYTFLDAKN